jgi:hypothetical protein
MGKPHSDETNVPIARRLATARLNAPLQGNSIRAQQNYSRREERWQLKPDTQDLIGLAGIESD